MKVLFTNQRLVRLGGAQAIVRDLASGLQKRGHTAVAYSSLEPPLGNSLAEDSVTITSNLKSLPFVPDVIHAHNHLFAMTAILALPDVPVVYCCHGATAMEKQPRHPRIVRYVAMSPTLRLRMSVESGIDEDKIDVVFNAVDLHRFRLVRNPPDRPRAALVYKRDLDPDSRVGRQIVEAAALAGLALEFRGLGPRLTPIAKPEEMLPEYDIVFTSGKSAIDALACGCAVILTGNTSCGDMVGEANFDRFRRANFSPPVNSPPPNAPSIVGQIERYDPVEAVAVSRRLREVADLEPYVDRFVAIYERAIEAQGRMAPDPLAEQRAAVGYLRSLVPWVGRLEARMPGEAPDPPRVSALRQGLVRQLEAM